MSIGRERGYFKSSLVNLLEAFKHQKAGSVPPYAGAPGANPLEHTTRVFLLDGIINALGWDIKGGRSIVEEARVVVESTLFIDYLGVNPDRRTPLLIIEAKAWDSPFVSPRLKQVGAVEKPSRLIIAAIEHVRAGGAANRSPVIKVWHEWLEQIHRYVKGLLDDGHKVQRVVITTGQWIVIFKNPVSIFCCDDPIKEDELVILMKDQFVESSDEIFNLIAYRALVKSERRVIRLSQLRNYMRPEDVRSVFYSLLVKYEKSGHSHIGIEPQIRVYPSVTMIRTDGQIITVHGGDRFTLPHDDGETALKEHLQAVKTAAEKLIADASTELHMVLTPSSIAEFQGFPPPYEDELATPEIIYVEMNSSVPDEGTVVTGLENHFLLQNPTEHCRFHSWAECKASGTPATKNAITVRSIDPRSFFKSGEKHHCANQGMHDRRDERCKIDTFDRYLCCQGCTFHIVCWPDGHGIALPCEP